jgi:hypothetical protein
MVTKGKVKTMLIIMKVKVHVDDCGNMLQGIRSNKCKILYQFL